MFQEKRKTRKVLEQKRLAETKLEAEQDKYVFPKTACLGFVSELKCSIWIKFASFNEQTSGKATA